MAEIQESLQLLPSGGQVAYAASKGLQNLPAVRAPLPRAGRAIVPTGPLADLVAALRHLHRRAGEPSAREIGRKINYSHTTVTQVLKGSHCPSWPVLKAIVTHLEGDLDEFRGYWIAVRDEEDPLPDISLSGRQSLELAPSALQDFMEAGQGFEGNTETAEHEHRRVVLTWKVELYPFEFTSERLALQFLRSIQQEDPNG